MVTPGKHLDLQPFLQLTSVAVYLICLLTFIVPPTINFTQSNQVDVLRIQSSLLQNLSELQSTFQIKPEHFHLVLRVSQYVLNLYFFLLQINQIIVLKLKCLVVPENVLIFHTLCLWSCYWNIFFFSYPVSATCTLSLIQDIILNVILIIRFPWSPQPRCCFFFSRKFWHRVHAFIVCLK